MSRHRYKWSINEVLSLQREYELLELSIQEIAIKHKRKVDAIIYKLLEEEFVENCESIRGYETYCKEILEPEFYIDDINDTNDNNIILSYVVENDNDNSSEITKLTERIWSLETSVSDINFMVKHMFDTMVDSKNKMNIINQFS